MHNSLGITFVNSGPIFAANLCPRSFHCEPLLPNTPALPQAARWWPRTLRERPHRQLRKEKGKGIRRRRGSKTWLCSASMRFTLPIGMCCERN